MSSARSKTADYTATAALAAALALALGTCQASGCAALHRGLDGAGAELQRAEIDVGAVLESADPARAGLAAGLALLVRAAIAGIAAALRSPAPSPPASSAPAPSSPAAPSAPPSAPAAPATTPTAPTTTEERR